MVATVGIARGAADPPGPSVSFPRQVLASWPRPPAGEVLLSPPTPVPELGRRASLIVVTLPAPEAGAILSSLRGVISVETVLVCTSPSMSLCAMRRAVGPGPGLFRAIVTPGTGPGEGIVALAPETGTGAERVDEVRESFAWVGNVEVMTEEALDAVAALTLGAVGFICTVLDGLEEGAARAGLPRETARPFVRQTALATALLLQDHAGSPADLKDQVASPGGTTIAALATLEDAGVRGAFIRAVQRSALEIRARRDAACSDMIE